MKKKKKVDKKWRSGKGTLWIIALVFASSGAVRLAGGAGQAIAKEMAFSTAEHSEMSEPALCYSDAKMGGMLDSILAREEQLKNKERLLEEKETSIKFAENVLRDNMDELVSAEQKLAATIAHAETASEDDLDRLTSVYENMKPKDASILFEEMSPEFAAGFLGRMRTDAAAQVMTGLTPTKAYSISAILAGRNANTPTE